MNVKFKKLLEGIKICHTNKTLELCVNAHCIDHDENLFVKPQGGVSENTLKSYCWMYSTFNLPQSFQVALGYSFSTYMVSL